MSLRKDGAFHVVGKGYLTLEEAAERGRRSFEAGTVCAPIHDSGFTTEACASNVATAELLDAWLQGWTRANTRNTARPLFDGDL